MRGRSSAVVSVAVAPELTLARISGWFVTRARALVLEAPRRYSHQEFELPTLGSDDGLLRVEACGLCGTDHEQYTVDARVKIELLTPDFQGSLQSVRMIMDARPDIFSHNIETVQRLYPAIRFKSDYTRSFNMLKAAKLMDSDIFIKTGIMVGLGETKEEITELMHHAVEAGVDILTIGQYLRPSMKHAEIQKYYHPDEFAELRDLGRNLGIRWVFSGPLVRSSYHAEDVFEQMMSRR